MRKVLLLFAAIVCQCYLHATITQEEAFRIAEKFVRDTTNEIMVTNQLYSKGDSVKMWEGAIVCPFQQAWCVFIDFYPLHNWAHECSYVFIDALNGDIKQEFKSTPPIAVSKLWTKYRTYILPKELQSKHKSLFQERLATFRNKASSSQTSIHSIPQGSRPHVKTILLYTPLSLIAEATQNIIMNVFGMTVLAFIVPLEIMVILVIIFTWLYR